MRISILTGIDGKRCSVVELIYPNGSINRTFHQTIEDAQSEAFNLVMIYQIEWWNILTAQAPKETNNA